MEHVSTAARFVRPIDIGLLAAAAQRAVAELEQHDDPAHAIEAGVEAFYEAVAGVMPSVFVLEHGRLWLVAQRGYAVVPDGIPVDSGITGRAVRAGAVTDCARCPRRLRLRAGSARNRFRGGGSAADRPDGRRRAERRVGACPSGRSE